MSGNDCISPHFQKGDEESGDNSSEIAIASESEINQIKECANSSEEIDNSEQNHGTSSRNLGENDKAIKTQVICSNLSINAEFVTSFSA